MAVGPRRFNIVNITIYLLIAVGIYGSIQYAPYYWKKVQLEELVKGEAYGARRADARDVITELVDRVERDMGIILDPEEISVEKSKDRVRIELTWRYSIDHPFKKTTHHSFRITQETVFY